MTRPISIEINSAAFAHNIAIARQQVPNAHLMAIVKADAYGHGVENLTATLDKADSLGVCCIEEALYLRELNINHPITLLEGIYHADELENVVKHQIDIVVHHQQQIDMLKTSKLKQAITVWLKLDTGMHRLGFLPNEFIQAKQQLDSIDYINKPIGLMTHLACADIKDHPLTAQQLNCFHELTQPFPGLKNIGNSAAILHLNKHLQDVIRPGIMLYGISPFTDKTSKDLNLRPVMNFQSEIIAIKNVAKGSSIGYGATWTLEKDSRIGVIAAGYGDGYPRHVPNGTPILINGVQVPIVGHVSMDMITVDLSKLDNAKVGDKVTLWGKGLLVELIAKQAGTIPYELVTGVNQRVKKIVVA